MVFDIGGVLEVPVDTHLDGRWEQRLGLEPGAFLKRLRRSGLGRAANLDMADLTVYSYEVGIEKPDRRIYLLTCERLGVHPGRAGLLG